MAVGRQRQIAARQGRPYAPPPRSQPYARAPRQQPYDESQSHLHYSTAVLIGTLYTRSASLACDGGDSVSGQVCFDDDVDRPDGAVIQVRILDLGRADALSADFAVAPVR